MLLIKLEVYDGGTILGEELQVIGIEVSSTNVIKDDSISDDKVGYDSWEHSIYAETQEIAYKKLLKYRKHGLFDHIASPGYIIGDNKLTDNFITAFLSEETQDKYPELYI